MMTTASSCFDVSLACHRAIVDRRLIVRTDSRDKEFHVQDWFKRRLADAGITFEQAGRNSYPDFRVVDRTEGYEIKGLAWLGREADFDANSQVPTGFHNGRTTYYVFGRYPSQTDDEPEYPVLDLVLCHGDFLNAHHDYVHENKSVKGFGTYGDIMIRDRKMYVAPTPFALVAGTTGQRTLIVPAEMPADDRLEAVGELVRVETEQLVVGYESDLVANTLTPRHAPNPDAGKPHRFTAYRKRGEAEPSVSLVDPTSRGRRSSGNP
jgi:hypothetical protein